MAVSAQRHQLSDRVLFEHSDKELHGVFLPDNRITAEAHVSSMEQYQQMYKRSIENPEEFWREIAEQFYWHIKPPTSFLSYNFNVEDGPIFVKWMEGAQTNICYNVLDRIVKDQNGENTVAFYWEGNYPGDCNEITYGQLLVEVCKFANVLKAKGVKKGDRVAIYLPMIMELVIAMLACARIGAVHSIVVVVSLSICSSLVIVATNTGTYRSRLHHCSFSPVIRLLNLLKAGLHYQSFCDHSRNFAMELDQKGGCNYISLIDFAGFSAHALGERLVDSKCSILITADGFYRGTKLVNIKSIADGALVKSQEMGHPVPLCIVVRHLGSSEPNGDKYRPAPERPCNIQINWNNSVDVWWHEEMTAAEGTCEPEWLDAEDPLFMLYTSGSTGKPKGVLHTTAGYMLYTATTFKYDFDYHPGEIYWCTADIGWITGHSYITYGPMANGATSVMFEGTPTYPDASRMWAICEKYKVSKFYTAPTAIRSLMRFGKERVEKHNRDSLKVLGTVGEPINPEAWLWYRDVVGNKRCPVVDTYWQTETGGHVITSLPGATPMKPGSATFPFFGIVPAIVDKDGKELEGPCEGVLVLKQPWPGMMRTIYGDHARFESVYFKKFPGYYYTGDECKRDKDGYYWIVGRVDDCMNVSGHLLSTAEIESALVEHGAVSEAAVVGYQHAIKGVGIFCYTTLMEGFEFTNELVKELKDKVREKIGPIATPDVVQYAPGLPKTRSGKIMRRVLRELAQGNSSFGDQTTLADPSVVDTLLKLRPQNIPGM